MVVIKQIRWTLACLSLLLLPTGYRSQPHRTGRSLRVSVDMVFRGSPLILENKAYRTAQGDSVYIDAFRMYISNVKLLRHHAVVYAETNSYHLIDAADSLGFTLSNVPANDADELSFCIGVDSATNVSGALDGDLDPVKGMYWAWNSGYINAKLEGHSPSCKTLHHAFEFHVGGYSSPCNTKRSVTLPLSPETKNKGQIRLQADAAVWFDGMDLAATPSIVMPSAAAMSMADRYANMFRISQTP